MSLIGLSSLKQHQNWMWPLALVSPPVGYQLDSDIVGSLMVVHGALDVELGT
jgi:hypothetical protein